MSPLAKGTGLHLRLEQAMEKIKAIPIRTQFVSPTCRPITATIIATLILTASAAELFDVKVACFTSNTQDTSARCSRDTFDSDDLTTETASND